MQKVCFMTKLVCFNNMCFSVFISGCKVNAIRSTILHANTEAEHQSSAVSPTVLGPLF